MSDTKVQSSTNSLQAGFQTPPLSKSFAAGFCRLESLTDQRETVQRAGS